MSMSICSFSYSRSGQFSLAKSLFRRSSDMMSPFPPSGNEDYISNRDVSSAVEISIARFILIGKNPILSYNIILY